MPFEVKQCRTIGAIATSACLAWVIVTMAALRRPLPALIGPPVTVPFDTRLSTGSNDIPLSQLSRRGGWWDPEQIHLALAEPGAIFVSWATHNHSIIPDGQQITRPDLEDLASKVWWGTDESDLQHHASGNATSYVARYPNATYVSGVFHHVKLEGLQPATQYFYRCGDDAKSLSKILSFRSPKEIGPTSFPQRIGIIGDLGQVCIKWTIYQKMIGQGAQATVQQFDLHTYNSSVTLDHLEANAPPVVWLVGDYAYSDNYTPHGKKTDPAGPYPTDYHNSFQPRWDTWGRFTEHVFAQRPLQGLHGNHEIESDLDGKTFQAFTHRYRYPAAESGSSSPHYYSFGLAGAHVIHLASYSDYSRGSEQYKWLERNLKGFSRARTPWLIVNFHAPWYHTYIAHYKEANCHRLAMEDLLYNAGVDMIFSGHVHAYSATNKVYNYSRDPCGITNVVIGDGGNIERLYTHWVDEQPEKCPQPTEVRCPTFEDGQFCPSRQPLWSAYREPSFGHGILTLQDNQTAVWEWHRNQDGSAVVSHRMTIRRDLSCFNQKKI